MTVLRVLVGATAVLVGMTSHAAAPAVGPPETLLSAVFQDHAVLQRDKPISVWGHAAAGEGVTVSLGQESVQVKADATGQWTASLRSMSATGPLTLAARTDSGTQQLAHDVLVGDVFLCSGQSNMELPVSRTGDARNEIAGSANNAIRMLTVSHSSRARRLSEFDQPVAWQVAGPETVSEWSAVCFYFARGLQKTVHVPIGLVHSSWGGANIRPWISEHGYEVLGGYERELKILDLYATDEAGAQQAFAQQWENWWKKKDVQPLWDPAATHTGWLPAPAGLGDWRFWPSANLSDFTGLVWYRTRVKLTEAQAKSVKRLDLGAINQVDQTWLNGHPVGNTFGYGTDRSYPITPGMLHVGDNTLVICVMSNYGGGGLLAGGAKRALVLASGESGAQGARGESGEHSAGGTSVPLDGPWQYQVAPKAVGYPPRAPWESVGGVGTLYNAMIAPLGAYGLRGVIWYQGESNTEEWQSYPSLLGALMSDWRRQFGADLPFLVVQLPNYGAPQVAPGAISNWASLREAQRQVVAQDPHAGLVVAIDIGEPGNLHPTNKQDVGKRLARAARHVVYGEAGSASGPVPLSLTRAGDNVIIEFTEELVAHGPPVGFELCAASCQFADARIDGKKVILKGSAARVRYCWADSPTCTVYAKEGELPAGPFELPIPQAATALHLNSQEYFDTQGLSVLAYQNQFHEVFRDQKLGGIEIILHGERIATDGEVRLLPTPEQWDAVPKFIARKRGSAPDQLIAVSGYPDLNIHYRIEVTAEGEGFRIAVHLDKPLPADQVGKAGFNLDFLPTAYFGKAYRTDITSGIFPRHPNGLTPLASGHRIDLSPEDPLTHISITTEQGEVGLFDARSRAQNGWFVVRSLIAANRTENALVWHIHPNVIPGWVRAPVVSYNQAGYTPGRQKVAILELDPHYDAPPTAKVVRFDAVAKPFEARIKPWGPWLRYQYATLDFSAVRQPGLYAIEYAGQTTQPFRIGADVYKTVWHPSLDTYLAVQMDHIKVRENYRVWHGASHMDDARQAPTNYTHFDGYAMGPTSDSPFAPGQHIPGLNVGGWFDAGDYDIRTQTQARVILDLVAARELFRLGWDQTTVDEETRLVQIRRPDGVPDIVQQIKHGVLALLAQYAAVGHAIPGIIEPNLEEYTHLGDAASKTDGFIYDPKLQPLQVVGRGEGDDDVGARVGGAGGAQTDGLRSGMPDDRWAFTTHVTGLNYEAAAALAAASRVLETFDDALAKKALDTAIATWNEEHSHPPLEFHSFNTTGGNLQEAELQAAVELLKATHAEAYKARLRELLPAIQANFRELGWLAAQAVPLLTQEFGTSLAGPAADLAARTKQEMAQNPFGVPIATGTWGGSGTAVGFATRAYFLHHAFPNIFGPEYTLRGFDYVLGRHPVSNVSYVSTVGTASKLVAYGNNRADYTFIPGGMIPGVVIIQPDFPELKTDWPFLWYENEYVVDAASTFIFVAGAAEQLSK